MRVAVLANVAGHESGGRDVRKSHVEILWVGLEWAKKNSTQDG
jgi:hypothetical protein